MNKTILDIIQARHPAIIYKNNNLYGKIYQTTFKEIKQMENIIKTPEFQTELNDDKIKEMKNVFNNVKHFIASMSLLVISKIVIGNNVEYLLVDGQHRYNMIIDLLSEDPEINESILVSIIDISSKDELVQLFEMINKDSEKCVFPKLDIFDKEIYEKIKDKLNMHYIECLPKRKNQYSKCYTLVGFIEELTLRNYFNKFRENKKFNMLDKNISDEIYKILLKKEKRFFDKIKYLEKVCDDNNNFSLEEKKLIQNKSCMFFKNNNFIDWLLDENIEPIHNENIRAKIPTQLKKDVWKSEFGSITSGKCPIFNCNNILSLNVQNSWQCGHIISKYNKGDTNLENLRPICPSCNNDMKEKNWLEWEEKKKRDQIIETYYEDDNDCDLEVKCKKPGCKVYLTKDQFFVHISHNKLKPYCKKCYNNDKQNDKLKS